MTDDFKKNDYCGKTSDIESDNKLSSGFQSAECSQTQLGVSLTTKIFAAVVLVCVVVLSSLNCTIAGQSTQAVLSQSENLKARSLQNNPSPSITFQNIQRAIGAPINEQKSGVNSTETIISAVQRSQKGYRPKKKTTAQPVIPSIPLTGLAGLSPAQIQAIIESNSTLTSRGKEDRATINLDLNQSVYLQFPANPTTGYSWILDNSTFNDAFTVDSFYYKPQSQSGMVGGGGTQLYQIKASQQGSGIFRLIYARPWMMSQCPFEETNVDFVSFVVFVGLPPYIPPAVPCCKCALADAQKTPPKITTDPTINESSTTTTP